MPLTPTTLSLNWSLATFTPSGGTLVSINRVSSLDFDQGSQFVSYSGDANRYKVAQINNMNEPTATLTSANIAVLYGIGTGVVGTLIGVLDDARNGNAAGGGALRFTLSNAVSGNIDLSAAHMAIGSATMPFISFSTDGTTNPLAVVAL